MPKPSATRASAPPASPARVGPPVSRWRLAAWRLRIRVALALGLTAAAGRGLSAVLRLSPGDAWALASRAHWHGAQGQWPQALADAEALVALHPQRAAADAFNLGFAREACGQIAAAEAAFGQALQWQPTLAVAWLGLARVQAQQGRAEAALAALARHAELQPWAPDGRVAQVTLLMQWQRLAEAQHAWDALRSFEPRAAWALLQQWPALAEAAPEPGAEPEPPPDAASAGEHPGARHEGESASPAGLPAAMMRSGGRGPR